jgi:asparagine synthase (glutamine-hydrolysing)
MPGILGLISPNPHREHNERQLHAMLRAMAHDECYVSGTYLLPEHGFYFGWVSHPEEFVNWNPIVNASGDRILIFSGEHLDPECTDGRQTGIDLLTRYERAGERFFDQLNGWFAGLVVDMRTASVTLFNDRYSLHRVYWHADSDSFAFASEAKALLAVRPATRALDSKGLGEFLALGTALEDRTIFSNISVMPGGSAWSFSPQSVSPRKRQYFDVATWERQPVLPAEMFYTELRTRVSALLPRYFQPAHEVGVSLTGGLDTRMMMAGRPSSARSAACYTYGGPYRDCFDVDVARQISAACGERHQTLRLKSDFFRDFAALAVETAWITDGTLDLTGTHEVYFSRQARQLAPIRMTGNYGSEILRSVSTFKYLPPAQQLFDGGVNPALREAAATFAVARSAHPVTFAAFKQVPWQLFGRLQAAQSQLTVRSPYMDNELVALMYQAPPDLRRSKEPSLRLISDLSPRLAAIRTDMGDGGNGPAILEFLRQLHRYALFKAEWYYGGGMPHWLTRFDHNPISRRLETLFVGSHKIEHYRLWFRDQLHDYVTEILGDTNTMNRAYLNRKEVQRLLHDHRKRIGNHQNAITKILSLELIHRSLLSSSEIERRPTSHLTGAAQASASH